MPSVNHKPIGQVLNNAVLVYGVDHADGMKAIPLEFHEDNAKMVRGRGGIKTSGILTEDTNVKAGAGTVYWISVSDTSGGAVELNDSTDDSGDDKWGVDVPENGLQHFVFDPPIECDTGIFIDIASQAAKVTVGYF